MPAPSKNGNSKPNEKSLIAVLERLRAAACDVLTHTDLINDLERLKEKIKCLETDLEQAKGEVKAKDEQIIKEIEKRQSREAEKKAISDMFESKCREWIQAETKLENKIEEIQTTMESGLQKEVGDLKKQIAKKDESIKSLSSENSELRAHNKSLQITLSNKQNENKDLMAKVGVAEMDTNIEERLQELEQQLVQLVDTHFGPGSLSKQSRSISGDSPFDSHQSQSFANSDIVSFPRRSANDSRPIVSKFKIVNTIASRIEKDIFQPLIAMRTPSGRQTIGDALQRSDTLSNEQKAILRSLLSKQFADDERKMRHERIDTIILDISTKLDAQPHWGSKNFSSDLSTLLNGATELWMNLQRSNMWIAVTLKTTNQLRGWKYVREGQNIATLVLPQFQHIIDDSSYLLLQNSTAFVDEGSFTVEDHRSSPRSGCHDASRSDGSLSIINDSTLNRQSIEPQHNNNNSLDSSRRKRLNAHKERKP